METMELQSTFELIDSIEFEEKVNIEDLVLPSEPTAILNAENIDIKQEPAELSNINNMPFHNARKTDILSLEAIDLKEEPLEQSDNTMSIHEIKKAVFPDKKEIFQSEMEKEIVKLFEEFDLMTRHDYDQMRVTKVRQLIEKYQRITQEVVLKLHEKTPVLKTNQLNNPKEEFHMAKSTDFTMSKRIKEVEMATNQVTDQKTLLKRDLNLNSETKSELKKKKSKQTRKIHSLKCEFCDKLFTRHEYRRNHVKQVHEEERPFKCEQCSNAFKEKAALQKHIYALHTRKKTFGCKHCKHGFVTKDRLKKHEIVCEPKSDSDSD